MTNFIRWQIFIGLVFCAAVVTGYYGIFQVVFDSDITFLTNMIGAIFLYQTSVIGMGIHKLSKWPGNAEYIDLATLTTKIFKSTKFVQRMAVSMGMLGTVGGFIFMLDRGIGTLDFHDASKIADAFQDMAIGMASALWTTAYGLVASMLLAVQLLMVKADVR